MKGISRGRRKSKTNRYGICFCCGDKLKNRPRNTEYCKECGKLIYEIKEYIYMTIYNFKKRHKEYNIIVERKINVTIKKRGLLSDN